ncbi:MAG: ATPase [SAR86 cluster bacterium]|uniref:ATPase n=1 Tax=SAR86 cluster bacterium TaxID=2030880 RepID=A0A2A5CCK4_9GAMM|nr:ATP-binding protein [Gammaproteobacteria bacterium AH-315-E17]PCJ41493.1 MAG: ATPase [SAR86 cluster bacterium]
MTQIHVLTGPESSGKTTLASTLANYWSAPLLLEQSRAYLDKKADDKVSDPAFIYQQSDILAIAKQQIAKEHEALLQQPELLICDTDLLVLIIWSEVKFGHCDKWILEQFEQELDANSRHYILCDWQIPWEPDPLRENSEDREQLFRLYQAKLKAYGIDYLAVSGSNMQRFKQVQAAIA